MCSETTSEAASTSLSDVLREREAGRVPTQQRLVAADSDGGRGRIRPFLIRGPGVSAWVGQIRGRHGLKALDTRLAARDECGPEQALGSRVAYKLCVLQETQA